MVHELGTENKLSLVTKPQTETFSLTFQGN
jgi:hypothetical protein